MKILVSLLVLASATASEPIQNSLVAVALSCFVPGFDESSGAHGATFTCQDFVPIAK